MFRKNETNNAAVVRLQDVRKQMPLWYLRNADGTFQLEFRGTEQEARFEFELWPFGPPSECHRLIFCRGCRRYFEELEGIEQSLGHPVTFVDC